MVVLGPFVKRGSYNSTCRNASKTAGDSNPVVSLFTDTFGHLRPKKIAFSSRGLENREPRVTIVQPKSTGPHHVVAAANALPKIQRQNMPKKRATPQPSKHSASPPSDRYWLVKSEPDVFSIDDLAKAKNQTTHWDGVRNYQARNTLRDSMKLGDRVLFYHSNATPPAIVGTARIVKEGYPDHTAFDPKDGHYDPKSKKDNPTWYMVDIQFEQKFSHPLTLPMLKAEQSLTGMELVRRGSRLSVQPVRAHEFEIVLQLAASLSQTKK